MSAQPITPAEINRRNSEFWGREGPEVVRRGANGTLLKHALMDMQSELRRGFPVYNQKILEEALQDAEARKRDFEPEIQSEIRRKQASIAGSAKKTDPLQELILALVRKDPKLTITKLRYHLERERHGGFIEEIDEEKGEILFKLRTGDIKSASIPGLKHRLSRAKKTIALSQIAKTPPSKAAPAPKQQDSHGHSPPSDHHGLPPGC